MDTWARIESEARARGVSAAQFVRESTIARLASDSAAAHLAPTETGEHEAGGAMSGLAARSESQFVLEGSEAVWAQARLARDRAREAREHARALQTRRTAARR